MKSEAAACYETHRKMQRELRETQNLARQAELDLIRALVVEGAVDCLKLNQRGLFWRFMKND